jgi:hypothetical protein
MDSYLLDKLLFLNSSQKKGFITKRKNKQKLGQASVIMKISAPNRMR